VETTVPSYHCHHYPAEIIVQCVRLYYRFPLSHRDIEELMFERGIIVSYESVRRWCDKFGPAIKAELRRRRPQPKGTWHLDEVFIKLNRKTFYLWRAVDADGMILDILVQERRNQAAAEALLCRLVDG
jgi:putative transposase